jgi:glycolate oxidase FAD binding subunit
VLALGDGGAPLIEWHGGQRWYKAPPEQASLIREAAHAAGGHATLFRMPPASSASSGAPRFDTLSAPVARIHHALMREFDPHGIFDRARLLGAA